jgi:hypothetical protein
MSRRFCVSIVLVRSWTYTPGLVRKSGAGSFVFWIYREEHPSPQLLRALPSLLMIWAAGPAVVRVLRAADVSLEVKIETGSCRTGLRV